MAILLPKHLLKSYSIFKGGICCRWYFQRRDKCSSLFNSTQNICMKFLTHSHFFPGGVGDEEEHLSGDEWMLPSRPGRCSKAAQCLCGTQPVLQKLFWSSCSERWGRDPCLSPGIDLLSATGLILSPRSEILSQPASAVQYLCSNSSSVPPGLLQLQCLLAGLLGWMQCAAGHPAPTYQILSKHLL